MAVSSLKVCWSKLSARIRDYIEVVDSYYRPSAEDENEVAGALRAANGLNGGCGDTRTPRGLIMHGAQEMIHKSSNKKRNPVTKHGAQNSAIISGSMKHYKSPTANHSERHYQSIDRHHKHRDSPVLFSGSNHQTSRQLVNVTNSPHHTANPTKHCHHRGHQSTGISGTSRLSQLGFTKRKTNTGQIYFVDAYGNRDYHDPSVPKELLNAKLDLNQLIGPLSSNWEVCRTASGKVYYTNHTKLTTQLTDPRLVAYKDVLMSYLRHTSGHTYETIVESQDDCTETAPSAPLSLSMRNTNHNVSGTTTTTTSSGRKANPQNNKPPPHFRASNVTASSSALACASSCQQQNSQNDSKLARNSATSANDTATGRRQSVQDLRLTHQHGQLDIGNNILSGTLDTNSRRRHQQALNTLVRGSHQNLSSTHGAGNSNTLTGPPPSWFKQPTTLNLSQVEQNHRQSCNQNVVTVPQNQEAIIDSTVNGRTNSNQVAQANVPTQTPRSVLSIGNRSRARDNTNQSLILTSPFSESSFYSTTTAHNSDSTFSENNRNNNKRELFDKISILRQELLKQQDLSHPCKIAISRRRIFEESFRAVSQMTPRDLKKRLLIKFRGEEGLDYGGVAREWFYLLSKEILNPAHGLFQYTSDDIYYLQINPDSGIVYREHLTYLNFCGRIIGLAVFHGHFIEGRFTLPFYKMLLSKPITLEDIEHVDPELHRSLCWILENDITDVLDTTFLVQHNSFGQLLEYELKENGRNISVTEENKWEYVSLYVNYRCRRGIEHQFAALQRGFYEIISAHLVDSFDEHELELLIGGLSKIDVDDWRLHTKLKNCTIESPLVIWFWDIVKKFDEDRRARLLQFVTGSPRVPIQGFKALQGVNSELRLFTIHMIRDGDTDNLPKSHTCFNRIDLPPYENYEKLRDKLTQAIEETIGFAMQ